MSFILSFHVYEILDACSSLQKRTCTNICAYSHRVHSASVGTHCTHKIPMLAINPAGLLVDNKAAHHFPPYEA